MGVEAAAELDQGLAVVEAFLVEDAVDAGLDGAFERIEDDAGDDDGRQQAPDAQVGQAGMDDLAGDCDDAEVDTYERGGRERIGDAALEDEIDVHETVTHDGPAEGEGQEDQRKPRELCERAGIGQSAR